MALKLRRVAIIKTLHRTTPLQRKSIGTCSVFVELDEIRKGHRIKGVGRSRKWIYSQLVLESRDQYRKAQRIESGIDEDKIIIQWSGSFSLLRRNLVDLINYSGLD
jgi:hypothetical protein